MVFVIITWNRKDRLRQCMDSLKQYIRIPFHSVVIDNGSTDGSAEMVDREYPDATLIRNAENQGFSKAANQGLDYLAQSDVPGDFVVFLNDDAVFKDDSLLRLFQYMKKSPDVYAALPSVFSGPNQLQTGVGGYDLTLRTAFSYFFGLSVCFPYLFKGFFIPQAYYRKKRIILELDWISGVCLFLKREAVGQLRFPEDTFMYAEDVALGQEIKKYGKIIYFPLAQVFHIKEKNSSPFHSCLWLDSVFQYYEQRIQEPRHSKIQILKMIFLLGFLGRILGYILLDFFSRKEYKQKRAELLNYTRHIWKGYEW
ncbi:MAG: glycosyltransferase [Candidatus Aminicenantes bacterium]|nr:glycosyltransferase [Candidatus Aminicenantes bacterium]